MVGDQNVSAEAQIGSSAEAGEVGAGGVVACTRGCKSVDAEGEVNLLSTGGANDQQGEQSAKQRTFLHRNPPKDSAKLTRTPAGHTAKHERVFQPAHPQMT